jgi:hypothetical protein
MDCRCRGRAQVQQGLSKGFSEHGCGCVMLTYSKQQTQRAAATGRQMRAGAPQQQLQLTVAQRHENCAVMAVDCNCSLS